MELTERAKMQRKKEERSNFGGGNFSVWVLKRSEYKKRVFFFFGIIKGKELKTTKDEREREER